MPSLDNKPTMSFLDVLNNILPFPTLVAKPKQPEVAAEMTEEPIFTTKDEDEQDVRVQGTASGIIVAVSGTNFKITQEKGRLIIEPLESSSAETYELLPTDDSSAKDDEGGEEDTKQDELPAEEAPTAPAGFASSWKIMTPFTDPRVKKTGSYLVPQILAIDIRPRFRDGVWTVPKTLVICSTRPALLTAKSKVETVLARLAESREYPAMQIDTVCPMATGSREDEQNGKAKGGERPVLICTPEYAKRFVGKGVEEIWWLNVRSQAQDWNDIDDLLQAFEELDGIFPCPIKVNVCFGKEDKKEAARVMSWLEEKKGTSRVSGLDNIRRDLDLQ